MDKSPNLLNSLDKEPGPTTTPPSTNQSQTSSTASTEPFKLPIVSIEKKGPKKALVTITVVAVLGIIGAGGAWAYSSLSMRPASDTVAEATVTPTVSATPSPSTKTIAAEQVAVPAGWKSFTSAKYGISFVIPNTWSVQETDSTGKQTTSGSLYGLTMSMPNKPNYTDSSLGVRMGTIKDISDNIKKAYDLQGSTYSTVQTNLKWQSYDAIRTTVTFKSDTTTKTTNNSLYVQVANLAYLVPDADYPPFDVQDGKVNKDDWVKFAQSVRVSK